MVEFSYQEIILAVINIDFVTTYINYVMVNNMVLKQLLVSLVYELLRKYFVDET
jgi:hypothetical protein